MITRLLPAIHQFRLWEESDFDRLVIEKLRRRAEDREAERVRRRFLTRLPRPILRSRRAELRAWEAEQTKRIQEDERERMRLEAIAEDPSANEGKRRFARIELAGKLYRSQVKKEL